MSSCATSLAAPPSTALRTPRTVVMVRDPRNVIMSERKMRIEHYQQEWVKDLSMDEFVRQRFEVGSIVADG